MVKPPARWPSIGTLFSAASTVLVLMGAYWYMEDNRRELDQIRAEVQASFEAEALRDEQWLASENDDFDSVRDGIQEVEDNLQEIAVALATANDDLNYRLGLHVGDHDRVNDLLAILLAERGD